MRKTLRIMAILAAFGLTAWIGVVALAQSSPTQAPTTTTTTTSPSVPGTGDEFKGNCDEAEHVNDPECQGVTLVPEDNDANDDNGGHGENEVADDHGDDNDDQGEDLNDDDQGQDDNPGSGNNSGSGSDDSGDGGNDDNGGEN